METKIEKFTFEEMCLMRAFDTSDREILRDELVTTLCELDAMIERDLVVMVGSVLEKLDELTDEEFKVLSVFLDVEDFYSDVDEPEGYKNGGLL